MSRPVPFSEKNVCDDCGAKGAYDFMGDYLCPACWAKINEEETKEAKPTPAERSGE